MALNREITLVFDEGVGGFTTFQTYVPESGLSLNNRFFSFASGTIWEHHNNDVARGRFYARSPDPSVIQVIFNDQPSTIKNFKTIGYEGDGEWDVTIKTDQESVVLDPLSVPPTRTVSGSINADEFVSREGKKFGYIRGEEQDQTNLALESIAVQGLGIGTIDFGNSILEVSEIPEELHGSGVQDGIPYVGDSVFYFKAAGSTFDDDLFLLGTVVTVDRMTNQVTYLLNTDPALTNPDTGDFFLFSKDNVAETSGVIGFYGIVEFTTNDTAMAELFSINSEVIESST